MTGEQFNEFLDRMGWTDLNAGEVLKISRNSVAKYRKEGAPRTIDYACAAIAFGLPPLSQGASDRIAVSRMKLRELRSLAADLLDDGTS